MSFTKNAFYLNKLRTTSAGNVNIMVLNEVKLLHKLFVLLY